MATAQWGLARTKVPAPTDGAINNLTVRVGDTATANEPLIGIIAEMMQVRLPKLLEQKVALWKSRQPFPCELLRFFLLPLHF